jgi:ubiquinone/menaquinone biosynthesis C-methylase UbiE
VCAFDLTPPMIRLAQAKLSRAGNTNWGLALADSRAMPLPDGCAGVAIEGWSFVQIMTWHPTTWRQEVGRAIREMLRLVRPGGVAILIETLGTGETTPKPPDRFIPAYDYFAFEWGFTPTWIRTDFRFPTMAEAQATIAPLFGEATLARAIHTDEGIILPECTGLWWCYV